jgi:hypothetical protein
LLCTHTLSPGKCNAFDEYAMNFGFCLLPTAFASRLLIASPFLSFHFTDTALRPKMKRIQEAVNSGPADLEPSRNGLAGWRKKTRPSRSRQKSNETGLSVMRWSLIDFFGCAVNSESHGKESQPPRQNISIADLLALYCVAMRFTSSFPLKKGEMPCLAS